jgi:CRP-like cAMP-binding protein
VLIQSDFLLNELSGKIEALSKLHCYKDVPVRNLVPLAGLLKEKKVRNGDYVLKEGDKVEGFMIIVSGTAVVTK